MTKKFGRYFDWIREECAQNEADNNFEFKKKIQ